MGNFSSAKKNKLRTMQTQYNKEFKLTYVLKRSSKMTVQNRRNWNWYRRNYMEIFLLFKNTKQLLSAFCWRSFARETTLRKGLQSDNNFFSEDLSAVCDIPVIVLYQCYMKYQHISLFSLLLKYMSKW